ncbi:hypothetical protein RB213_010231 [Colletotrichum asianum]
MRFSSFYAVIAACMVSMTAAMPTPAGSDPPPKCP